MEMSVTLRYSYREVYKVLCSSLSLSLFSANQLNTKYTYVQIINLFLLKTPFVSTETANSPFHPSLISVFPTFHPDQRPSHPRLQQTPLLRIPALEDSN